MVLPADGGPWTSLVDLHLEICLPESVSNRPDHRVIHVRKFRRGPAGWRGTVMAQFHFGRMIDLVPEGDPGPDPFRIREPLSDDLNWVRTTDSGLSSVVGSVVHSELEGHRGQSVDELGLREALDINVWGTSPSPSNSATTPASPTQTFWSVTGRIPISRATARSG